MGNFSISGLNQMATENEVATILSNFNNKFMYDVISNKLENRFVVNTAMQNVNIVGAFDQNFKDLVKRYPSDIQNIETVKMQTYKDIVDIICSYYKIEYTLPEIGENPIVDYFTIAYYLYDFLVDNFFNYVSVFYANYIYKNKDAIYDSMNLDAFKKGKDISTLYGKKIFTDQKIAIISANIIFIVGNLKAFDITPDIILYNIYGNSNIVALLNSILVNSPVDFFKTHFIIPKNVEAMLYTNIRLELQRLSQADGNLNQGV